MAKTKASKKEHNFSFVMMEDAKVTDILKQKAVNSSDPVLCVDAKGKPAGWINEQKLYSHLEKEKSLDKKVKKGWLEEVYTIQEEDTASLQVENLPAVIVNKKGQARRVITPAAWFEKEYANLIQQRNIAQVILESAYEGIAVVDKEGRLKQMNQAYRSFLGIDPDEDVSGRPAEDVIENTRLHEVVRTGIPEKGEIQVIQGQKMVVHRLPIWEDGEIAGAVGMLIFEGVSELYRILGNAADMNVEAPFESEEGQTRGQSHLHRFEDIIGESRVVKESKSTARKSARTNATVLITGESGTGKELFAQAIHLTSGRKGGFISVNCAAIPEHLLESELFGYEEGAFTGAKKEGHTGKFEAAHNGTIFLDEIGNMSLPMQAKILRVLEERAVTKVGGLAQIPLNVKVIAATNANLEKRVKEGTFREDLYYRLHVIPVDVAPLRQRPKDIPLLFSHYMQRFSKENNIEVKQMDQEALEAFMSYEWPGNIRELMNVTEQLVTLVDGNEITLKDLPDIVSSRLNGETGMVEDNHSLKSEQHKQEKQVIIQALEKHEGNKSKAAQDLGIHRTTLYKKIKDFQIEEKV
ncbi:transcriptional regulator [Sinobaca qinghaiensis]|uniref:Transcriptional regulator n=1 Tax=Sinobaca qinghaiensis TaxID=342944 RepID=A0A419V779_9BACL|nr:sigma 54-interacting transcriptional regulator [Sinobaca qinghaiensis]RKD75921.1 transcriptional regulator [Sinobaca qinghaiensis]